jgi:hypothetical protein
MMVGVQYRQSIQYFCRYAWLSPVLIDLLGCAEGFVRIMVSAKQWRLICVLAHHTDGQSQPDSGRWPMVALPTLTETRDSRSRFSSAGRAKIEPGDWFCRILLG